MIVPIWAEPEAVIWEPADEVEEIVQNVRMILRTTRLTCPLYREFGARGDMLDLPIRRAESAYRRDILGAVARFEPRAEVVRIEFDESEALDGKLSPKLTVRLRLAYA